MSGSCNMPKNVRNL